MSTQKIATSTLWQLASQIAMAVLSIVTVKFVAVGLSKELAGTYNSAYGFLQPFGILADFGLYAVAVREVSKTGIGEYGKKSRENVLGALIVLRLIILIFSLSTSLIFIWLLPIWKGTALPLSVTIASLVPFFTLLAGIVRTVFQVEYKMHYIFIAEVLQRVVAVSLIGSLIVLGIRNSSNARYLHLFLFFGGIGAFILFSISLFYANRLVKIRPHFDIPLLKKLAFAAAPFGVAYLFTALYREFGITMIALLRSDFAIQNAYYGFVMRIMGMGFLIPTFLLNSTLPILENNNDNRLLLGKTLFTVAILGTVSALFALLWARPIMQLLTTDAYLAAQGHSGSDTALALLSISLLLTGFITYGFYVLLHLHEWKRLLLVLSLGALVSISLNLILIPLYGFIGAAVTSVITHIFITVLLLPQALIALPIKFPLDWIKKWLFLSILLIAFLWLLRPILTNELSTAIGFAASAGWLAACIVLTKMREVFLD